jgi:thiol-disulfide isomerase/thioredoxin
MMRIAIPLFLAMLSAQTYPVGTTLSIADQEQVLPICANSPETTLQLKDLNGDLDGGEYVVTILSFFTSWCTNCQSEVGELNQMYEDYYQQGLRVLSFGRQWNYPYNCSQWADLGATYPLLDDDSTNVWYWFGLGYVPQNVILDHNMTVQYSLVGFNPDQMRTIIEQLLTELPTVAIDPEASLPNNFHVSDPYPNPFNPTTTVTIQTFTEQPLSITVYNLQGHQVANILPLQIIASGKHTFRWDASGFPTGTYFIQIAGPHTRTIQKVLLLK